MDRSVSVKRAAAFAAMGLALMGLLSYLPGLRLLGSAHPEYIPMAPSTAVSFLIFSAALLGIDSAQKKRNSTVLFAFVMLATVFGFLEFVGFLAGLGLNLENRILPDFGELRGVPVGRMSPGTALFFILAGAGLLPAYAGKGKRVERAGPVIGGIIGSCLILGSLTFLLGYLFGTPLLYNQQTIPMALTTAAGFFFLGMGLIQVAGENHFPLRVFSGPSTYARLMRIFIPLTIAAILAHSIFLHFLRALAVVNNAIATAVLAIAVSAGVAVIVSRVSRSVADRVDNSERKLLLSRERYRSLFDSIRDAILVADTERKIIDCNPAFTDLFGYAKNECLGRPTLFIYENEEEFARLGEKLQENIDNPNFLQTIYYRRKSGAVFPGETNVYYLRDVDGKITGFIGLIRDITERKQAEAEAHRSRQRLSSLVDNLFDGLVVTDPDGTIRFVNPAACKLFGRGKDQLLEAPLGFPVTADQMFEVSVYTPEGEFRYAEARATLTDWEGEARHLISLRDVTERRLAAKEREEMKAHLQQIQRIESIGTLAGGIAHDFNNILSPMLGYTELAMDQITHNPAVQESLDQVYRAGQRAKDLVKQILAFSRQAETEFHPMQPATIVKEAMKMLRSTLPATIEIRQKVDSAEIVMGDATGIHQILMNLCTNAKYAMAETGGTLSVSLEDVELSDAALSENSDLHPGTYVRMRVQDTGCGIEPAVMEKIFEPYFTTKKNEQEEGTGLGLSVAHGIVKQHGGFINVESRPGQGTAFDVYLPASERQSGQAGFEQAQVQTGKGTEHILFVDDEPAIVKLNRQILERLGYQVTTRTSSVEALELFKSKPDAFDLLITDLTMPQMTGEKLALACMRVRPDLPVILATGFSEQLNPKKAEKMGIHDFIYKPVSKVDLSRTIRKVLDKTNGNQKISEVT